MTADYCQGRAVNHQGAADDVLCATELLVPVGVADYCDGMRAELVVVARGQQPSCLCLLAEDLEELSGDELHHGALGRAGRRSRPLPHVHRRGRDEGGQLGLALEFFAGFLELRPAEARIPLGGADFQDFDELLRAGDRQLAQHHGVQDCEHRSGAADAQGQQAHRDDREQRTAPQHAEAWRRSRMKSSSSLGMSMVVVSATARPCRTARKIAVFRPNRCP
ncbi:MAG: hypothetical protein ABIS06_19630 [Vicinamibacterales bacterium]